MSVAIKFDNVIKRFGDHTVIPGLSLEVEEGEFFTLLGPSGCGKTTLLRMVIGFNSIEGGTISFNDKIMNDIPPNKRNIGMVFQNYAVFPHMTVEGNIAFGLKNRKLPQDEIDRRVANIMDIVQISELKDRTPDKMSGGQQQRVALARAVVIEPDVLLMDEPLSNLDAMLRVDMRNAIKEIQNSINITTIYVTHDQEEAMAISDRIAVMNYGVIQQIGTPQSIYHRPTNVFVATFIGNANILDGVLNLDGEPYLEIDGHKTYLDNINLDAVGQNSGQLDVKVSIRPEEFILSEDDEGIKAKVVNSQFLGLNTHFFVEFADGSTAEIIKESSIDGILATEREVYLKLNGEKINVYSADGETAYTRSDK